MDWRTELAWEQIFNLSDRLETCPTKTPHFSTSARVPSMLAN